MSFLYYPESDMLYTQLAEGEAAESEELSPGVVFDYADDQTLLGVEIESASEMIGLSRVLISSLPIVDLVLTPRSDSAA